MPGIEKSPRPRAIGMVIAELKAGFVYRDCSENRGLGDLHFVVPLEALRFLRRKSEAADAAFIRRLCVVDIE